MNTNTTPHSISMNRLRRRLMAFGAVAALGLGGLAACADDDDDPLTPGDTTTTTLAPDGLETDTTLDDGLDDDMDDGLDDDMDDDMDDGS